MNSVDVVHFASLSQFPWLVHGFIPRIKGVAVDVERHEAIARLRPHHDQVLSSSCKIDSPFFAGAEQVHGSRIAVVKPGSSSPNSLVSSGVDGLLTAAPGLPLGIYVADCCAIYLVEPARRIIGILHSGKKGTELGIATEGVGKMVSDFGAEPGNIVAVLSPCIRGCCYDLDFAVDIENQLKNAGVKNISGAPECTSCHLDRYYSYRKEKGKTGRMLAFLMIREF